MTLDSRTKYDADQPGVIGAIIHDLEAQAVGSGVGTLTLDKTLAPGASPGSYTSDPTTLLSNLLYALLAAEGVSNWDVAPPTTLAAVLAHYTANGAHGIYTGSGDPTGSVSATAPAFYVRSNGSIYVKTGSGTSGWIQIGGNVITPNSISCVSYPPFGVGDILGPMTWKPSGAVSYPASNRAILVPFYLPNGATVKRMWVWNAVPSGNIDMGVYTSAFAKVIAAGSTAGSGSQAIQFLDFADTPLTAGAYYMAIACSTTGATFHAADLTGLTKMLRAAGAVQMATAFPLPSTITPAAVADDFLPFFGIELGSLT